MFARKEDSQGGLSSPLTLAALLSSWQQERQGGAVVELNEVLADENGLTEAGHLLLGLLAGREVRPHYDLKTRELRWRGRLVKRLERAGCNQVPILLEFQRLGWPPRIEDPLEPDGLTDTKARLRETVRALNAKQQTNSSIRFYSDDGGVRWEAVEGLVSHLT